MKIKMPGFTAEASLCKTSVHYKTTGTRGAMSNRAEVFPQQILGKLPLGKYPWGLWSQVCTRWDLQCVGANPFCFNQCVSDELDNIPPSISKFHCCNECGGNNWGPQCVSWRWEIAPWFEALLQPL